MYGSSVNPRIMYLVGLRESLAVTLRLAGVSQGGRCVIMSPSNLRRVTSLWNTPGLFVSEEKTTLPMERTSLLGNTALSSIERVYYL